MPRKAVRKSIRLKCRATSANLGAGFDVAGMALEEPFDVMEVTIAKKGIRIVNSGAYEVPTEAAQNTCGAVLQAMCKDFGIADGFLIKIEKSIKPASGLGSSAATAAGTAVALNELYRLGLSRKQLVRYASLGEQVAAGFPHTDNVSPALLGGIVFSSEASGEAELVRFPPVSVDVLVILPDKKKGSTKEMRAAIPEKVEWKSARSNLQGLALLFAAAAESDAEKFMAAVHKKDAIVERARSKVQALSHLPKLQELGDAYGFGVFASGAGPAVLAVCLPSNKNTREFEKEIRRVFGEQKVAVELVWTKISEKGVEPASSGEKESWLQCTECGKQASDDGIQCAMCSGLLEVKHDFAANISRQLFEKRGGSGVWRFKELVHPSLEEKFIVTRDEGNTFLYSHAAIDRYAGVSGILLKHEGENPTGSFKDRGMTVAVSEARRRRAKRVACASTGNTSASMAAYASLASIPSTVFIPEGKIAAGKLSQSLAYGAAIEQVEGNFDAAMEKVQQESKSQGMYLLNSVNPWRIEGQKTIIFELLLQLKWKVPEWIAVPAGNLGNTSAFGKALEEAYELKLIDKIPRLLSVQAEGAAPFFRLWKNKQEKLVSELRPETVATAIRIGNPVSWRKALKAITFTKGIVEKVSDQEIMEAKAVIDAAGIGCEPASAATLAGVRKVAKAGIIQEGEKVVCILTGHLLKDPDATIQYHKKKLELSKPKLQRS